MAVKTSNKYGRISTNDEAIALVAGYSALDCYGVHELVSRKLTDSIAELFNKQPYGSGVKVTTDDNKIYIDIYAVLKYGVNVNAVTESLKNTVSYNVENFTGMIVKSVNVNIIGIKV